MDYFADRCDQLKAGELAGIDRNKKSGNKLPPLLAYTSDSQTVYWRGHKYRNEKINS